MSAQSSVGLAGILFVRLFVSALVLSSAVAAAPASVSPLQFLGDWEATRLIVTDGFSNSQRSMNPDDARIVGRKYSFQSDTVTFSNYTFRCTLDTSIANKTFSMKVLFAGERTPKPKLVRDRFYRSASQYALGPLARERITIYAYRCTAQNSSLTQTGNWFAVTKDSIIWPEASDALVIMKRQPNVKPKEQIAFCNAAQTASDKTICADREMWLMKTYADTVHDCAIAYTRQLPEKMREDLNAFVAKREACEGARDCIYSVLQEHVSILGQRVASVPDCLELKKEKK